jgi:ATP-dependent protease ClpP protease subunit
MRRLLALLVLVASLIGGPARAEAQDRLRLVGPITAEWVPVVQEYLQETATPEILIDSPVGSQEASEQIADLVTKKGNVKCTVKRFAASGAFAIFQACAVRVMGPKAQLVTHEPMIGVPFPLNRAAAAWFLAELEQASASWNARCRARLKLTPAQYEAKVKGRDWVMGAKEAIEAGAADRVVP